MKNLKILLIGEGRLAGHLKHLLSSHHTTWLPWNRSLPLSDLTTKAGQSELALLAVSDRAIDEVAKLLPRTLPKIHFSGSVSSELAVGIHPLMTFGTETFPLSFYAQIPLVADREVLEFEWFKALPNPKQILPKEQKGLYHALCHLSGNFSKLLWEECFEVLEKSTSLRREIFRPYLEQSLNQVIQRQTDLLAGPFGRDDQTTIANHKSQLIRHPRLTRLYSHFQDSFKERNFK